MQAFCTKEYPLSKCQLTLKRKKKKQFLNANENNHENVEYKLVLFEGKEGTFTGMFTVIYIYVHTHIYICVCVCVCVCVRH